MSSKSLLIDTKLDEHNFSLWEFSILILLEDEKLLILSQDSVDPPQIIDNARAKRAIVDNCTQDILKRLITFKRAPEMWAYLYATYSGTNVFRKYAGIKKLATLQFKGQIMEENLMSLERICHDTTIAAGNAFISIEDSGIAMFLD